MGESTRGPVCSSSSRTAAMDAGTLHRGQSQSRQLAGLKKAHQKSAKDFSLPTDSSYRIHLTTRRGTPVMFEYGRDKSLRSGAEMTYKTASSRGWYEVGDLISCVKLTEDQLVRVYPELRQEPGGDESVLLQLAIGFLTGPPAKYRVAKKIISLSPSARGGHGRIILRPVLFLDDKTFIELETTQSYNRLQLHDEWVWIDRLVRGLEWVEPVANFYAEVGMAVATGLVGGAVKTGARTVARKAIVMSLKQASKEARRRYLRSRLWKALKGNMMQAVPPSTLAYAKSFLQTMMEKKKIQSLGQRATRQDMVVIRDKVRSHDRTFQYEVLLPAHIKAWSAFVSSMISESVNPSLMNAIKASGLNGVQQEISARLIKPFTTGIPTLFVNAVGDAAAKAVNDPGSFEKHFADAVIKDIADKFKSIISVDIAGAGVNMLKG